MEVAMKGKGLCVLASLVLIAVLRTAIRRALQEELSRILQTDVEASDAIPVDRLDLLQL